MPYHYWRRRSPGPRSCPRTRPRWSWASAWSCPSWRPWCSSSRACPRPITPPPRIRYRDLVPTPPPPGPTTKALCQPPPPRANHQGLVPTPPPPRPLPWLPRPAPRAPPRGCKRCARDTGAGAEVRPLSTAVRRDPLGMGGSFWAVRPSVWAVKMNTLRRRCAKRMGVVQDTQGQRARHWPQRGPGSAYCRRRGSKSPCFRSHNVLRRTPRQRSSRMAVRRRRRGGGGIGTRPQGCVVCLWRRLLAPHHCSF